MKKAGSLALNANTLVNVSIQYTAEVIYAQIVNKMCTQGSCFNKINNYYSITDIII